MWSNMMVVRVTINISASRRVLGGLRHLVSANGTIGEHHSAAAAAQEVEWRKKQLDKLEQKFSPENSVQAVSDYDDVQPMWKEMESRVTKRRPLTAAQRGARVGRMNVRKTDEEIWLKEGLYDGDEKDSKTK